MQKDIFTQVRESAADVMSQAKYVRIDKDAERDFAAKIEKKQSLHNLGEFLGDLKDFDLEMQLRLTAAIDFSNARTWGEQKWGLPGLGGSNSLNTLYARALKENRLWSGVMSREQYLQIVDCGTGIKPPRWEERWNILREGVDFFVKKYNGSVLKFLETKEYNLSSISAELLENFPNFRDVCSYNGRPVYFYKLLQLIISDFNAILKKNGLKGIPGAERRTALADYKIPQILCHLRILEYKPSLAEKVDNKVLLPYGSPEEVEIRAAMVVACEEISALAGVPASVVGDQVWLDSQKAPKDIKPHHRTETLFY